MVAKITEQGPTLQSEFIIDDHAARVPVTVLGDDTINGELIQGTALGMITVGGKYGKYDDTAIDGREVMRGLLWQSVTATTANGDQAAVMVVHGVVDESQTTGVDAAGKVDVGATFIWM